MSYWGESGRDFELRTGLILVGYKFETLSLIPDQWHPTSREYIEGREDMVVSNYAQYCSVVKTGIGKAKLVIGGEVDARKCHGPRPNQKRLLTMRSMGLQTREKGRTDQLGRTEDSWRDQDVPRRHEVSAQALEILDTVFSLGRTQDHRWLPQPGWYFAEAPRIANKGYTWDGQEEFGALGWKSMYQFHSYFLGVWVI